MVKKAFLIAIVTLLFNGCENNKNFEATDADTLLPKYSWYEVDPAQEKYIKYQFSPGVFVESYYTDKSFTTIKDEKRYNAKIDKNSITLYGSDMTYNCSYSSCEDGSYILLECNPQVNGLEKKLISAYNNNKTLALSGGLY